MLKETLVSADKLMSKIDLTTVVVYSSSTNNCCVSCHTNDDLVYVYVRNKSDGYVEKEFSLRSWDSIHSILGTFYSPETFDKLKMNFKYNDENYPSMLEVKNGRLKMNYYLQNYSFLRNQQQLLDEYNKKKLALKPFTDDGVEFEESLIKDISKLSSLTNEEYFKFYVNDLGTYICFGDENQSADNASIKISDEQIISPNEKTKFPVNYFINIFKSLMGNGFKIKLFSDKIIMCQEDDKFLKIGIIRGRNI